MTKGSRPGLPPFASHGDMAAHRIGALGLGRSDLPTPRDVVRYLVAIQSQEHRVARWSVAQRIDRPLSPAEIDDDFDRGELIRTHVLRPTWHFVSPDDLRWLVRFSGPRVAARNSRYWAQFGLDAQRLAASTDVIAAAVQDGPRTRPELGERLARQGNSVSPAELAAMVMHAELHMAVCSGPMRGRRHTYVAFDDRAGRDGPVGDEALAVLARRYFTTRGPATVADFVWWAGLSMGDARRGLAMAAVDLEFHELDGRRYAYGPRTERATEPAIDFVQCYDEAVVSYRQSRDLLRTPLVSFEPLRREDDGFRHPILRNGQLFGRWRLARDESSIELRLDGIASPAEEELLATQQDVLLRFLTG